MQFDQSAFSSGFDSSGFIQAASGHFASQQAARERMVAAVQAIEEAHEMSAENTEKTADEMTKVSERVVQREQAASRALAGLGLS